MLAAFIKFIDDELREASPGGNAAETPAPRPPDQEAAAPARGFADALADAYLAIEEGRFDSARQHVDELVDLSREPSKGVGSHCPHCSRRVVSVELHVRTCPALGARSAAHPAAALDPQIDAARAAQHRLARAVLAELRSPLTPPGRARSLWCAGAGLLHEPSDGESSASGVVGATGVDPVTAAFSDVVVRLFSEFVLDVSRELQSVVSMRAVGDAGWQQSQQFCGRSQQLPPFLARFRAVLGPPPWDATGRPVVGGHASAQAGTGLDAGADTAAAPSPPTPRAAAEVGSVPHIDAVTRLLGEAASWLSSVLEQPVPHRDRCYVADALHAACVRACLPILEAYRADIALRGVVACASALLAHVVRVPVRSGSRDPLDVVLEVPGAATAVAPTSKVGGAAVGGAGGLRGGFGGGRLGSLRPLGLSAHPHAGGGGGAGVSALPRATPAAAPDSPPPPLGVYAGAALAIIDLVADQTSFVCQLLERYMRCLTVCTARGPAGLPSRPPPGDGLASAMHELQADYVLLEHAYTTAATRQLVCSAEGWEPVRLHEDASVATFSWVDDALYVLSKSLARAAATCCDMAAAAALNYAAEAVGDVLGEAAVRCVDLAGGAAGIDDGDGDGGGSLQRSGLGVTRASATRLVAGVPPPDDDSEAALAAQLSSALLGRPMGASAAGPHSPAVRRGGPLLPGSAPDSARGRPQRRRRSSAAAGAPEGGGAADEAEEAEARARAACALNSLHTVTSYLRATFRRALGQYSAVFAEPPLPPPSESGGGSSAARAAARASEARHAAALIHAAEAGEAAAGPPSLLQAALEPLLRRARFPAGLLSPFLSGEAGGAGEAIAGLRAPLQDPLLQLHRVCAALPRGVLCAAWRLAAAASGEGLRRVAALLRGARYVLSDAEYDWLTAATRGAGGEDGLPLVRLVTGSGGGGASCLLGPGSPLRAALALLEKPDVAGLVLACAAVQCAAVLSGEGGGGGVDTEGPAEAAAASWRLKPVNEYGALIMHAELRGVAAAFSRVGDALLSSNHGGLGGGDEPGGAVASPAASALLAAVRAAFAPLQQRLAVLMLPALADAAALPFARPLLHKAEVIGALLQRIDLAGVYALPAPPLRSGGFDATSGGGRGGVMASAPEAAAAAHRAVHGALRGGIVLDALLGLPWEAVPVIDADAESPVDAVVGQWMRAQGAYASER